MKRNTLFVCAACGACLACVDVGHPLTRAARPAVELARAQARDVARDVRLSVS